MGLKKILPRRTEKPGREEKPATVRKPFLNGMQVIRILVVALLAMNVMVFLGIFFSSKGVWGYRLKSMQVSELEARITSLKRENQKLYRKILNFKNDSRAQERLVREQLGWARDTEIVMEFFPSRNDTSTSTNPKP